MPKYEMIIHVESANDMATIVQACQGSAELISSTQLKEEKKQKRKQFVRPATINPGGLKGVDLVRRAFADGKPHTSQEMASLFASNGFSHNSASPALSVLHVKTHEIKMLSPGNYIATPKLKQLTNSGEH